MEGSSDDENHSDPRLLGNSSENNNSSNVTITVDDKFVSEDFKANMNCDCRRKKKNVYYRPNGLPHLRSQSESVSLNKQISPKEVRRIRERLLRTHFTPQATGFSQFDRRQKLVFISLALVDFVSFCSMSIMAPFFPKEVR
jgi:hypothetical protein